MVSLPCFVVTSCHETDLTAASAATTGWPPSSRADRRVPGLPLDRRRRAARGWCRATPHRSRPGAALAAAGAPVPPAPARDRRRTRCSRDRPRRRRCLRDLFAQVSGEKPIRRIRASPLLMNFNPCAPCRGFVSLVSSSSGIGAPEISTTCAPRGGFVSFVSGFCGRRKKFVFSQAADHRCGRARGQFY
jgi:hypothetical protein